MRNLVAVAFTVTVTALAGGCLTDPSDADPGDGTDGKADGNGTSFIGYIQGNSPFYWATSDYAGFTASAQSIGLPVATPIASTDALTRRLQTWVDRIDALVRDEVKRSTGSTLVAPRPIVEVLPSGNTFNAWVSPVVACSGVNPPGALAGSESFLRGSTLSHSAPYQCVRPTWPGADEFRVFWNRAKPGCTLAADLSVGGTSCAVDGAQPGELAVLSTSPYIHVSTDLIKGLSEPAMVVVLAHELGHYYRAHVSDAVLQRYNFWYDTELDRKKLPVPAANAADLQAKYAEIVNGPRTVQATVPGHYSPRLRAFLLTGIAPLLTERTEPGFVCAAARDALGPWVPSLLDGYGTATEAMTSYLRFEAALVACAPRLDLTGDPGAHAMSFGQVIMAVFGAKLTGATFPFHATLADVLAALDTRAVRLDQKAATLTRQVSQNRIGLYTTEQEADEIALEISTRLGLAPDQVLESWLGFMTAIAGAVPPAYRAQYEQANTSCKALLDAGFSTTSASGTKVPVFVPIGDLSEPHHSDCYRLFNFWRAQKLRKYQVTTPVVFEAGWDALQAEAQQLSADAATRGM